jgi:hypothetical protein
MVRQFLGEEFRDEIDVLAVERDDERRPDRRTKPQASKRRLKRRKKGGASSPKPANSGPIGSGMKWIWGRIRSD